MGGVNNYKDKVVEGLFKGLTGLVKSRKIEVVQGHGRLVSPTAVEVDGRTHRGRATSCSPPARCPRSIPGLEIDHARVITSDDALGMDTIPGSVVILGAGAIGCEFASVWRSFGAEVTIVEALPHLVPLEEESSSKLLERAFRKRGIKQELGARFERVEHTDERRARAPRGRQDDRGRAAARRDRPRPGVARTSATSRSASRWSAASSRSTPTARPTSRRSARSATSSRPCSWPTSASPRASSSPSGSPASPSRRSTTTASRASPTPRPRSPPSASPRKVAKERGYDVVEATYDLAGNGKARILGTAGAVKVLASKDGPVLGVHMVGERVGELIAEAQLITNWEALPGEVAQLIHPHPTMSEAVGEAHLALAGKPLHSHS